MPLTLRVWFSGLVHFIENKDPLGKCQLCAVLPGADGHHAAIYKVKRELCCGKYRLRPVDLKTPFIDLTGRRATFRVTRVDDVPPSPRTSFCRPDGIVMLDQIVGEYVDEYAHIVYAPAPNGVQAQVLFEGGYTFGIDPEFSVLRTWDLPSTLTGQPTSVPVADPVYIEIPNVRSAAIYHGPHSSPKPDNNYGETPLYPDGNEVIEVLVSNRCDGQDSFRYEFGDDRLTVYQIDSDFATHYSMLRPTTLTAINRVVPNDSGKPRYPLPESVLIDLQFAPHLCSCCMESPRHLRRLLNRFPDGLGNGLTALLDHLAKAVPEHGESNWLMEVFNLIIKTIIATGTGVGSGSDCLGAMGSARFIELDDFIPSPAPSLDAGAGRVISRGNPKILPS